MPAAWYRLNSNGTLVKIKSLYRLNSNGTLVKLKSLHRLNSNGILVKVFAGLITPSIKSANPPLLYIVDPSNFADPYIDAYTSYKLYLTRGRWTESPTEFLMRIQRSTSSTFSSPVNLISETKTYTSYSDSDFEDKVPLNNASRPVITNELIRAGNYYRGYVKATNSDNLFGEFTTALVKPRIDAQLSITKNLNLSIGYNPTANGGTFSWTYTGYESIVAADVYSQTISFYPQGNTAVSPVYSETISPGTSTTAAPTSTVVISNAALQPNTTYTVTVVSVMNDLWKTDSSLKTTASDYGDFTTAAAKPATPVITSATDVGTNRPYNNGAISLSWNQPTSSVTITGYKIEYSVGPDHIAYVNFVSNTGNTNTSGTFTGLDANKNYQFYVTALSAVQNSDRSSASSSVLITTVPQAPTGVFAVAGNADANVYYTATPSGSSGGKSVQYYRATSNPGSITATDNISPILVEGLTNYTVYSFTVAAYNANGFSAESNTSGPVTPKLPLPVGSGTVTITYDSTSSYVYKITSYGTWSNSASTYDYEWQTSADNSTWTTRSSGTDVATIPNYNAATYKGQFIRLRVYGRNQTGPAVTPLVSATTTIFYITPTINSFSVTGAELSVSYSYSYSSDDPSTSVELEYKLSSGSTWTTVTFPPSSGNISLASGTYDFRLFVSNSASGAFRTALSTVNSVVVSSLYSFAFGNVLYPSNNGHIGLTGGSNTTIPSTGTYLSVFPGDYVGNTSASPGYMLVWSDDSKYVVRFDGYVFGQFGVSSYRIQWMATFYTANNYVDIKIIQKGSSIAGTGTVGLYKDGVLRAGVAGPYSIATGSTFRVNYDGSTGSSGISYDEISITAPNDIMTTAGTKSGSGDDDIYYTITTSANAYRSPVMTIGTITGSTSTLSIPFTESNGCDYVQYTVRTGSYSGTIVQSSASLTSPINLSSLSANTTYYITLIPFNYKNQLGTGVQTTALTAPPQPTATFSSVTSSSFTLSWSATGATHYYVDIFNSVTGVSLSGYPVSSTTNTSASPFGLSQNTSYSATVYARNSVNGFLSTPRSVSQTTLFSGLTPTFGTNTRGSNQFTGSVTNYSTSYTWSPSVSAGTFNWGTQSGSTRPFTVTNLNDGQSSTVTMQTSRPGYDDGSAQTTGTSLLAGLVPTFETNVSTSTGFTGAVTNYDSNFGWGVSVTPITATFTWGTQSGSRRPFTVTGLSAGASATVDMITSGSIYKNGSGQTTGSALALTKLATPTNVAASTNRTDGINITWSAVTNAAYYGVWYGGQPSYNNVPDFGGPNNPTAITGISYLDTSVSSGATRDYYVQAFRTNNPTDTKSEWSSVATGTRLAAVSAPVNTVAPSVTPSTGAAGTTFSTTNGTWTNSPTSYAYLWQYLEGSSWITTGQTTSTFSSTTWAGFTIRCRVTATNAGGSTQAFSNSATVTSAGSTTGATQITYVAPTTNAVNVTTISGGGIPDDGWFTLNLPFTTYFNGTAYSQIHIGTNSYATFGGGSGNYSGLSASNPAFNKIMVGAGDCGSTGIYFTSSASQWTMRYDGSDSTTGSPVNQKWELQCNSSTPKTIRLSIVQISEPSGITGMYSSSTLINNLGGAGTSWNITSA